VLLRDVGSHHGTWRGETRLQSDTDHELKDGEIVTFGKEIEKHGQVCRPATGALLLGFVITFLHIVGTLSGARPDQVHPRGGG
jgi:hypothetical protein